MNKRRIKSLFFVLALLLSFPQSITAETIDSDEGQQYYEVIEDSLLDITEAGEYTLSLQEINGSSWSVNDESDVTSWFVNEDNNPAFVDAEGIASVKYRQDTSIIDITVDTSKITGFTKNGSGELNLVVPSTSISIISRVGGTGVVNVGSYTLPTLSVNSDIQGYAYTHVKSTLKELYGVQVEYDPNTNATLQLDLATLDNSKIDSSNATIELIDGDGYYASEYIFNATSLTNSWSNGEANYALTTGDLEIDRSGYLLTDTNSGREWSCLGGDGNGHYTFTLKVSGITYNGLPVSDKTFQAHVYIYGQNYINLAQETFGDGLSVDAEIAPLSDKVSSVPSATTQPVWTWVGDGDKPIMCDALADDFYITWPSGVDASNLQASDVTITMYSQYGDAYVLSEGDEYVINSTTGETQVAVTLLYWPNAPVYTTMKIEVNKQNLLNADSIANEDLSETYDIASVYVHQTQQGGGGTTVDGTVTAYSFYGFANLASADQITSSSTYTLSVDVDGATKYYAENNGTGILVDTVADAKIFDGNGIDDNNIQVVGNTVYITTRRNQVVDINISGTDYTFTKTYAGGKLLGPNASDTGLTAEAGYVIPTGTSNWATHESWPWHPTINTGWTGIDVQPYGSRFTLNVEQGATQQFTAEDQPVTWSIVGEVSAGTTISDTGLLTIAKDESATSFIVMATSTVDLSINGKGAVAVSVKARTVSVDKSDLSTLVEEYKDVKEDSYTADSYAVFKEAYDKAVVVLADDNATQEEVDKALEDLKSAYTALVLKDDSGIVDPTDPDPSDPADVDPDPTNPIDVDPSDPDASNPSVASDNTINGSNEPETSDYTNINYFVFLTLISSGFMVYFVRRKSKS